MTPSADQTPVSLLPKAPRRQFRGGGPLFKRKTPVGLGDAVEVVAKPVAKAIDRVLGTNLEHCGGCARRKAKLNALVPSLRPKPRHAPHARHDG